MDLISSRTLVAASLSTLAALASLPGPPQRVVTYCHEIQAFYEFVPGDVTPAHGLNVIAPTGGTAGRWLLMLVTTPYMPFWLVGDSNGDFDFVGHVATLASTSSRGTRCVTHMLHCCPHIAQPTAGSSSSTRRTPSARETFRTVSTSIDSATRRSGD